MRKGRMCPMGCFLALFILVAIAESHSEGPVDGHLHHQGSGERDRTAAFNRCRQAPSYLPVHAAVSRCSETSEQFQHVLGARSEVGERFSWEAGKKFGSPVRTTIIISPLHHRWFFALLSTFLMSLAPFLIIYFIPLNANDAKNQPLLRILLSFVSGGLLGDAFLHLIPHSRAKKPKYLNNVEGFFREEENEMQEDIFLSLWILAGLISFLLLEKVIRYLKGGRGRMDRALYRTKRPEREIIRRTKHGNFYKSAITIKLNGENNVGTQPIIPQKNETPQKNEISEKNESTKKDEISEKNKISEKNEISEKNKSTKKDEISEKNKISEKNDLTKKDEIRVSGYLNLAADIAHNFTDGLAIGASFLAGQGIGWVTSLTILLHELPHEIGDFALLIQSGCSRRKAIALQLVTTVGAFAGCLASLVFGSTNTEGQSSPVMAFTAGGFIYIATVSVIPELLSDVKISQSLKEIFALVAGIGLMVVISMSE